MRHVGAVKAGTEEDEKKQNSVRTMKFQIDYRRIAATRGKKRRQAINSARY